jgi:hypothetical protein
VEFGTSLAGRYRLDQLLGRGETGEVWRCHDLRLGRDVAVRVLAAGLDPDDMRRSRREAEIAGALRHPGITVVFDIEEHDGQILIVSELLRGQDLARLLKGRPDGLPASQAVSFGIEIASALAHAHRQGFVHRDLKPQNLFVQDDGPLKVCDFGIARDANVLSSLTTRPISAVAYIAPEQWEGKPVSVSTDLYQLGCLLYEMLTGRPPFQGPGLPALIHQHLAESPVPPRDSNPRIPGALSTLVVSLLAKAPADRPASAAAVLTALTRIQDPGQRPGQAVAAPATQVTSVSRAAGSMELCAVNAAGRFRYCSGTTEGDSRAWGAWTDFPLPAFGKVTAISTAPEGEGLKVAVVANGVPYLSESPGQWRELPGMAMLGLPATDVAIPSGLAGSAGPASAMAYVLDDEGRVWGSDGARLLAVPITGQLTAIAAATWGKPDPVLVGCAEEDVVCRFWWAGDRDMRVHRVPGAGLGHPVADLACAALAANRLEVFVLSADGRIWASTFRNVEDGRVDWSNWAVVPLPPGRVVQITACPLGRWDGAIFAATDDGAIHQAQYGIEVARMGHATWSRWSTVPVA